MTEAAWNGGMTSGSFQGKYQGQIDTFSIQGGKIVDSQGTPVDGNQIIYPSWDPQIGLMASTRVPAGRHAVVIPEELGDLPQPALPVAYGDEDENEPTDAETLGDRAYAARVAARLGQVRTALKDFTPSEKDALINEGDGGTRAGHLLNLAGTHYEQMPAEEDTDWLW